MRASTLKRLHACTRVQPPSRHPAVLAAAAVRSPAPKNPATQSDARRRARAATKKQEQYTAAAEASSPQNNPSDENAPAACRVTVAVRIKPTDGAKTLMRFGPRQENALRFTHVEEGKTRGGEEAKAFAYDHLFDQADRQADLYRALGSKLLQQVVSGQNASVFACSQTGSGKTYAMLGTPEERGLIRVCRVCSRRSRSRTGMSRSASSRFITSRWSICSTSLRRPLQARTTRRKSGSTAVNGNGHVAAGVAGRRSGPEAACRSQRSTRA